jgi:hypothetical protein
LVNIKRNPYWRMRILNNNGKSKTISGFITINDCSSIKINYSEWIINKIINDDFKESLWTDNQKGQPSRVEWKKKIIAMGTCIIYHPWWLYCKLPVLVITSRRSEFYNDKILLQVIVHVFIYYFLSYLYWSTNNTWFDLTSNYRAIDVENQIIYIVHT